jgi:hypothetical protein
MVVLWRELYLYGGYHRTTATHNLSSDNVSIHGVVYTPAHPLKQPVRKRTVWVLKMMRHRSATCMNRTADGYHFVVVVKLTSSLSYD